MDSTIEKDGAQLQNNNFWHIVGFHNNNMALSFVGKYMSKLD